jgi:hypothetical protein
MKLKVIFNTARLTEPREVGNRAAPRRACYGRWVACGAGIGVFGGPRTRDVGVTMRVGLHAPGDAVDVEYATKLTSDLVGLAGTVRDAPPSDWVYLP